MLEIGCYVSKLPIVTVERDSVWLEAKAGRSVPKDAAGVRSLTGYTEHDDGSFDLAVEA
ncbi:hypothetical protein ACHAQJ_006312 [Trichoderma viride]